MLTDLFAVASGFRPSEVLAAVAPGCRRQVDPPPRATAEGDDLLLHFPEWRPRRPARHLVPAFSALGDTDSSFRFELSARLPGAWSPWVGMTTLGAAPFPPMAARAGGLESEIDLVMAAEPVERVRLRLRLRCSDPARLLAGRWLVTLSASDLDPGRLRPPPGGASPGIPVPCLSQMEQAPALQHRICSPACVAMVLGYWGVRDDPAALAAETYHPGLDRYGVWPAAIRAAARRGVLGYLLRFPDWASAAWYLDQGLPVIASVRYAAGELEGAAVPETEGHLLVLRGRDETTVLVNDPAAPPAAGVERRYRLDQIVRIWLGRSGVGYVLFRPGAGR